MISYEYVFFSFHSAASLLGCILNAFLIYCVLTKSTDSMKTYSILMINFALTDFLACFLDSFVQARQIPTGSSIYYISNGYCKYISHEACIVGYVCSSIRYIVLIQKSPSRNCIAICLFVAYIPSTIQWITFLWAFDDTESVTTAMHQRFPEYDLTGKTITGHLNIFTPSAMFTIGHMVLPVAPVYTAILILRNRIIKLLESKSEHMRKETKAMHTQLLRALTFQAIIPGFFLFAIISYTLQQTSILNHPILENFTFTSFLFIPILSPICSLTFIRPFRTEFTRVFLCQKQKIAHGKNVFITDASATNVFSSRSDVHKSSA